MNLSELAKEPKLTKVTIDDSQLVKKYGEAIEFWVYDRVDMSTFMKLANLEGKQQMEDVVDTMKELILDEKGNRIINDKNILPNDVMIKAVKDGSCVGKLRDPNFADLTPQVSNLLILDAVARRYSVMPSYVMKFGDSLDMRCANLGNAYEAYLNKKQKGGGLDKTDHGYTTQDLKSMLQQVKERKDGSKNSK